MDPLNVNQKDFPVEAVLYNDGDFSVVWGLWKGNEKCIGMRWNDNFPTSHGKPVWLLLPEGLNIPLLKALLGHQEAENDNILEVLKELVIA